MVRGTRRRPGVRPAHDRPRGYPRGSRARQPDAPANPAPVGEPVVVHLRDARSGEMDIFSGTSRTRLRDPDLAARLARAAR